MILQKQGGMFSSVRDKITHFLKTFAFLDGRGCACGGQGIIHELEVKARQKKQSYDHNAEKCNLSTQKSLENQEH